MTTRVKEFNINDRDRTGGTGGTREIPSPDGNGGSNKVNFRINGYVPSLGRFYDINPNHTTYVKVGENSAQKIGSNELTTSFSVDLKALETPHIFYFRSRGYASDQMRVRTRQETRQFRVELTSSGAIVNTNEVQKLYDDGWRIARLDRTRQGDSEGEATFYKYVLELRIDKEVREGNISSNFSSFEEYELPIDDIVRIPLEIYIDDNDGQDEEDDDDDETFDINIDFDSNSTAQRIIKYSIRNAEIINGEDGTPQGRIRVKANNNSEIRLFSDRDDAGKYELTYTLTNVGLGTGFSNSVGSGDYKRVTTLLPKIFDLGSKDVDVQLRVRKIEADDEVPEFIVDPIIDDDDGIVIIDPPIPTRTPILTITENSNVTFNIQDKSIKVRYRTKYTDKVFYSLAGREKELRPDGSPIILTESDFRNGLGTYKLALRPYSRKGGTGDIEYATIRVINEYNVPEPDITRIRFPEIIDGEDFEGFDIDFDVNWTSVNTTYVNVYIDSDDKESLVAKKRPANGKVRLNVAEILKKSRRTYKTTADRVDFNLYLIPYNSYGDKGRTEKIDIRFNQGLRLRRRDVVSSIRQAFERELDASIFNEATSEFLTHNLHLGEGDNKLISTWAIDTETFSDFATDQETGEEYKIRENRTLVLKLYEPLPDEVGENDKIWISKIQSIPVIEQITLVGTSGKSECVVLEPNFNLDFGEAVGYEILDDLVASGSTTSNDLVNTFVSKSEFTLEDLHFNFSTGSDINWDEFVKYSSAEERVNSFFYKVKVIENYEAKYSASLSTPSGSINVDLERKKSLENKNELINSFDKFEKFLFESSSADGVTYPKTNDTGSYLSTTSSAADTWYSTTLTSAREYDRNNYNSLVKNLPNHIVNDDQGQEFVLFFNMVGQHFDNIYSYIEGINKNRVVEHKIDKGINDRMIYHMLQSLGWNANYGVEGQALWEYAFGVDRNGENKQRLTGKERQEEIWRRILNNLPYLLKYKGTKNSLSAILSIYGIPNSLLTILEFGGPNDITGEGTRKFTFEDRTAALNLNGTGSLSIPWNVYSSSLSNDYPQSIEMRVFSNTSGRQTLIENEGNWYVDIVPNTGSLATFEFGIVSGSSYISSSTPPMPFYNDEFTQIVLNKENFSSGSTFELIVKEGFQERIRNEVTSSLLTLTSTGSWDSGSELLIGSSSRGTFTGQIDEFRLWRVPLDELSIDNHTLMPEAIDGQSYSSSIDDLLLRNDFEYPRNLTTSGSVTPSGSIKNVSINRNYGVNYISASNFTSQGTYPYNYIVYDRTVTAKVPSTGITYNNKFRFEELYNLSGESIDGSDGIELSVKLRKTKREFDQAEVDSNKLGLLFSPTKEINMNILKSLGSFNIDDYIGSPDDRFNDRYPELDTFRNYYFDRFNLNLYEYINIVRLIEKTLFDTLESLVPARAKVAKGLLIEPHLLQRNKTSWKRSEALRNDFGTNIDTREFILTTSSIDDYNGELDAEQDVNLVLSIDDYNGDLDAELDIILDSDIRDYDTVISYSDEYSLESSITRNSGSTMAGIEVEIDAQFTGSVEGEYVNRVLTQVGNDSLSNLGFGLWGRNGDSIRIYYDIFGNFKKERIKAFKIKREKFVRTPVQQSDGSINIENVTEYNTEISILPFTGSEGSESIDLTVGGDITEVTPLNGYFQTHYKYVGDLTTGLKRSYHDGSKQTSDTTLDGASPVETFITNPNQLIVTDAEPILIVPGEQNN